jgi:hypothetical protein
MRLRESIFRRGVGLLTLLLVAGILPLISASPTIASVPVIDCSSGDANESVNGNVHIFIITTNSQINDANCVFTVPSNVYAVDYLVVAGGGGGNSGGGGAGGLVTSWSVYDQSGSTLIAPRGTPLTVYPTNQIPIQVGVGGSGGSGGNYNTWGIIQSQMNLGANGHDSIFGSVRAVGGGRGGFGFGCSGGSTGCDQSGANGGSGGGGAYDFSSRNSSASNQSTVVGSTSLGNGGGAATGSGGYRAGSGGGGAGSAGLDANVLHIGGAGGRGVLTNISGTGVQYACGGGGGINDNVDATTSNYYDISLWTNGFSSIPDGSTLFNIDPYPNQSTYSYKDQNLNTWMSDGYYFSDPVGNSWTYDSENSIYYDSNNLTWQYDGHGFTDGNGDYWTFDSGSNSWLDQTTPINLPIQYLPAALNIFQTIDTYYAYDGSAWTNNPTGTSWTNSVSSHTWTHTSGTNTWLDSTTNETWNLITNHISGGGTAGCNSAGRGSDIGVYGPSGASPATNATNGVDGFGGGGGGTDPESTVAGHGGSGVIIIRYVVPDPDCPNDGSRTHLTLPLACPAALTITAGSSQYKSINITTAPYSYTNSGTTTASIVTTPIGMDSTLSGNQFAFRVPVNSDQLTGGTYPVVYDLTDGAVISESYILITVIDPNQRTPRKLPLDPRSQYANISNVLVGNISAVQVCVYPQQGYSGYSAAPDFLVNQFGSAVVSEISSGGIKISGTNADVQETLRSLKITKKSSERLLLYGGRNRIFNLNVSNTLVGGNGSCSFGTPSSIELYPIGLKRTVRIIVPLKQ